MLPEDLIETELFGFERGAFTGAISSKKGRFELADGGTLFLDEIEQLPQAVQIKLLRVLNQGASVRLGGTKSITVDIRLIAATTKDLEEEVKAGRFREALYYRLNVLPLNLPPLRERQEDIPLLATIFTQQAAAKRGRNPPEIDPALIEALQSYKWPGNIRELQNLIERLVVLTPGGHLTVDYLPEKMLDNLPKVASYDEITMKEAMTVLKKHLITQALKAENYNRAAAAKRLGISRRYLGHLSSELNITETKKQVEQSPEKVIHPLLETVYSDEISFDKAVGELQRRLIIQALQAENYNRAAAAKRLGISRRYLHSLAAKLNITGAENQVGKENNTLDF